MYLYLFRGLFSKAKVFENFEIPPESRNPSFFKVRRSEILPHRWHVLATRAGERRCGNAIGMPWFHGRVFAIALTHI